MHRLYNPLLLQDFEWVEEKDLINTKKHDVSFEDAQQAFCDPERLVFKDLRHSADEPRYLCVGKVEDKIVTVRFTYRGQSIRIIGAGKWRKGKKQYETKRRIY